MNKQVAKAENEISNLISLLEKYPHRIEYDPASYVTAISNKIGILFSQERWKEIAPLIKNMRDVPVKYKLMDESKFTVRLWLRIFNLELELYRDTGQLTNGIHLIAEVENYIRFRKNVIPGNYSIMLYYQMACIYFSNNDFAKSLDWVNEIINYNFEENRNDLQCYARILNLMIHFELNNIIVLRYAVDGCRRFFKKKKNANLFEQQILLMFSRLSLANPSDYKEVFKKTHTDIYAGNIQGVAKAQSYIDLKAWIEKKMGKKNSVN
jgi:hypothetical protein